VNYYCFAKLSSSNGKVLRRKEIKVGIDDLVMLRGYGVFDYLRTYSGKPFRLNDYLNRFENSARGMRMKIPVKRKKIVSAVELLLKKNNASVKKDFGIRLLLTGGYSLDSYLPARKPNFFILIEDLPHYPSWYSSKGIKLMLYEFKREFAFVKTINYLTAIQLAGERKKQNAQDTLYCRDGKILETTRNNFFVFHGHMLVTAGENVLHGISRKVVLELAEKKFNIEIRDVLKEELTWCTECFITGTTRGITPVVQVNGIKIRNGKPGRNTKMLMKLFEDLVKTECK
jgi:D-alanine transaminase/branched-chain amino acid aminotransferase